MIINQTGGGKTSKVYDTPIDVTPNSYDQTVSPPEGYDGMMQVVVAGDSDLKSSNIKKGVNIFGFVGNYDFVLGAQTVMNPRTITGNPSSYGTSSDTSTPYNTGMPVGIAVSIGSSIVTVGGIPSTSGSTVETQGSITLPSGSTFTSVDGGLPSGSYEGSVTLISVCKFSDRYYCKEPGVTVNVKGTVTNGRLTITTQQAATLPTVYISLSGRTYYAVVSKGRLDKV